MLLRTVLSNSVGCKSWTTTKALALCKKGSVQNQIVPVLSSPRLRRKRLGWQEPVEVLGHTDRGLFALLSQGCCALSSLWLTYGITWSGWHERSRGEQRMAEGLAAGEAVDHGICCSTCDVFVASSACKKNLKVRYPKSWYLTGANTNTFYVPSSFLG